MSLRPTEEETALGRVRNEHLEDLAFVSKQAAGLADVLTCMNRTLARTTEALIRANADKKRLIGIIFKLDAKLAESLESIQDK